MGIVVDSAKETSASKAMAMNTRKYIEQFCKDRKHLIKKYSSIWGKMKIVEVDGLFILEIPSPQLLAGFTSYMKKQFSNNKIYFRGEKHFNSSTVPSLFRNMNSKIENEITNRKQAFDELVNSLSYLYRSDRFKKDFSPLIQHYGIKTDWLDLVDNIFVAFWFSNNGSNEIFSYIKLFVDTNLVINDLREITSSLSLRPHCQHGLSATKNVKWNAENIDFNDNLVAIVRLPIVAEMQLNGYIFSNEYMFPNEDLDNTYKVLKRKKFQTKLDEITSKYGLVKGALGKIK